MSPSGMVTPTDDPPFDGRSGVRSGVCAPGVRVAPVVGGIVGEAVRGAIVTVRGAVVVMREDGVVEVVDCACAGRGTPHRAIPRTHARTGFPKARIDCLHRRNHNETAGFTKAAAPMAHKPTHQQGARLLTFKPFTPICGAAMACIRRFYRVRRSPRSATIDVRLLSHSSPSRRFVKRTSTLGALV